MESASLAAVLRQPRQLLPRRPPPLAGDSRRRRLGQHPRVLGREKPHARVNPRMAYGPAVLLDGAGGWLADLGHASYREEAAT
jgi:hypothetical protein